MQFKELFSYLNEPALLFVNRSLKNNYTFKKFRFPKICSENYLKFLLTINHKENYNFHRAIASNACYGLLEKLPKLIESFEDAISSGNLEFLKELKRQKYPISNHAYYYAAEIGSIEILEYLKKIKCQVNSGPLYNPYIAAAYKNDIVVLVWLKRNKIPYHRNASNKAAEKGNIRILDWFVKNHFKLDNPLLNAVIYDQVETVKWLFENKVKDSDEENDWSLTSAALSNNNIELFEYLLSQGIKYDKEEYLWQLIEFGNLEYLKKRVNIDFQHIDLLDISMEAVRFRQIEILKWAFEEGYGICERCIEALLDQDMVIDEDLQEIEIKILNFLKQHDSLYLQDDTIISSIDHEHIFKWFIENNFPYDKQELIAELEHYEYTGLLSWLSNR